MTSRDIVVIGASAGGVQALQAIARGLPENYAGAIFVVLHLPPHGRTRLPEILSRSGPIPAHVAEHQESIKPGAIYVAPSDRHLIVRRGWVELSPGPRENGVRPAADPLFRSAARAYRARVVGVVLSGTLADGTAGLGVVKQNGGLAVVQDPNEAQHAGMPLSALQHTDVDFVLPVDEIGPLLASLQQSIGAVNALAANGGSAMDNDAPNLELPSLDNAVDESIIAGTPTGIACPACGGALWERDEAGVRQYRCYLGHNYALANLLAEHWEALESALWNGVRTLRERAALLRRAGELNGTVQSAMVRARYQEQAVELEDQAQSIVQLIESVQHSEEL